jgi:uncharacterized damage-inducible protein DinB
MAEKSAPLSAADGTLRAFAIHNRIHLYLLDGIAPEVWSAAPPGGKGRTIAALIAHIHKVRLMWMQAAKAKAVPAEIDKAGTIALAKKGLETSGAAVIEWLEPILKGDAKISGFKPDAWAFAGYLIAHEAHHRGQILLLARQLGHPVDQNTSFGLWEWGVR